jgi:hypothetical protein
MGRDAVDLGTQNQRFTRMYCPIFGTEIQFQKVRISFTCECLKNLPLKAVGCNSIHE